MGDEKEKAAKGPLEVKILRDVWDKDGNRQRAGAVIEVSHADAKKLIKAGIAELA